MHQNNLWKQAQIQSANIPRIKNKNAKERQIVLLCETLKKALGKK